MNIEKETYYSTLRLEELYARQGRAAASYGGARNLSGVCFALGARGKVRLTADHRSLSGKATLMLDGKVIAITSKPFFEAELRLEKGEHVFSESVSGSHGGVLLLAEGNGIKRGEAYLDRVGGSASDGECVVYLKRADGAVEKWTYDGQTLSSLSRTEKLFDEAFLYDSALGAYTATKRQCFAGPNNFTVISGVSNVFSYAGIKGLAMCDSRTLTAGADYLVAFVDANGALRFVRVEDGTVLSSSDLSAKIADAKRVVGAQRGSIFLVEGTDRFWRADYFHAEGEKTLTIGEYAFRYDEIAIGKTTGVAPTATTNEAGAPVLYCRTEEGRMKRLDPNGNERVLGYGEAYHPAPSGGLLQFEGELEPFDL